MGGGGGGKLLVCTCPASTGLSLDSVGACVTRLGGGIAPPADTGGPNLLLLGAAPLLPFTLGSVSPFLAQGILPTTADVFFLGGGPGSGVFLVP